MFLAFQQAKDIPKSDPALTVQQDRKVKGAGKKISPAVSLTAGGFAGGVEALVTYPFEFAKTRVQLFGQRSSNPFTVISVVARNDGFFALYTGCSTLVLGTVFKAGVRFLSFDSVRNALADENGRISPVNGLLAGTIAGCVESVVAVTPTERIKTALIDDAKLGSLSRYRGGFHAFRNVLAEGGISEIYRGLISTTMKQTATSAARMGSYNVLKETANSAGLPHNSAVSFGTGAIAGVITVFVTQPLDTIKTKAQCAKGASMGEAFRSIILEDGIRGFWRGSTMRLGRLVLSGGIVFTVYENVAQILSPQTSARAVRVM